LILYKLTNRKTGLSYIGATTRKRLEDRLVLHRHRALKGDRTSVLHQSIQQDGWEQFDVVELARPETHDELMAMEIAVIAALGTLTPNGFNMTAGGIGQHLRKMTDKNKASISRANKGKPTWNTGKTLGPLPEETRRKISAANTGHRAWNLGLAHSDESKAQMSASQPKRGAHHSARPLMYDGVYYACVKDACEATGLTKSQMIYRLHTGRAQDVKPRNP
jgi:group I intron endonuclease